MNTDFSYTSLLLLCSISFLTFCTKSEKPENLLSEDTYVQLIVELQLAQATAETVEDSLDRQELVQKIFAKYGVEYQRFIKSHRYYSQDIQQQQKRLNKAMEILQEKKVRKDSTKTLQRRMPPDKSPED